MILLVGLGNPGPRYEKTRHNFGFLVVDAICTSHGFSAARSKFQGEIAEGFLPTQAGRIKTLALKPMTFMNDSGQSVAEAVHYFDVSLDDVIVFHDELDLAAGKVRVKKGGGLAGHNGLKSIDAHLSPNFRRVRLGIGHPGDKAAVLGYALKNFTKSDWEWVDPLIEAIVESAPFLAAHEDATFMNRVHLATHPEDKSEDGC
jgi:PTH1 family peptidyl-tRNA hydrolase